MPVDITEASFKRDPHPLYAALRAEAGMVEVSAGRGRKVWLATRYESSVRLLKDERFVKDRSKVPGGRLPWMPGFARPLARNMLDLDDPDHRRLRALVHQAFTPRLVEGMRGRIETLTRERLERAASRRRLDLIADFAVPIPTTIIAEMLGVPAPDRARFHRWTGAIVAADASPLAMARAVPAMWSFLRYLRRLIALKRTAPAEDLMSALIAAAEDDDRLNEDELVAMAFLLLVAGHETTVNLIGNGLRA
jgi:cytochrome P450